MKKFKPSLLTLGLISAGVISAGILAPQALAQEADEAALQDDNIETIEVKGFRRSLIKALNTKRFSDVVVDAISADDIGGLPDVSIADALSRIPGVTSTRINGQSSELNIRGLSGDFVMTTLNGREMVSTSGGRSVQFDQFPSELIQQAQIYKSQKASLIEGGVAGSVELQTINALDLDQESAWRFSGQINNNSESSDNPDADSIGNRLTVSYQRKLFDDTLGFAVGYARLDQPSVSSRFVSYAGSPTNTAAFQGDLPEQVVLSTGFEVNQRGGNDIRDSFIGSLNWDASDNIRVRWDGFYTEFDSETFDRGLLVGESGGGIGFLNLPSTILSIDNPILANTGGTPVLVGATFTRDPGNILDSAPLPGGAFCNCLSPQIQNDNSTTNSKSLATGITVEWEISDNLSASFDIAHSSGEETDKDEVARLAVFEDSSAATPITQDNIILQYQLNGLTVPDIAFTNLDFADVGQVMLTSYERYPAFEENTSDAIRADFEYTLESDYVRSVEFGVRYSEREYKRTRGVYRIGDSVGLSQTNTRNGAYIAYGLDADFNPVETGRVSPYQLSQDQVSIVNFGGDLSGIQPFISVNNLDSVISQWITEDISAVPRWNGGNTAWSMQGANTVDEEVTSAYLQANLDFELGSLPVTGNIGVRAIETKQESLGLQNVGAGNGVLIADGVGEVRDDYVAGIDGDDYRHYLPSLNLNFKITEQDQIRFAYAKVLSRPDLTQMTNQSAWTISAREEQRTLLDGTAQTGYWADLNRAGNPRLRPFEADAIDISYEHYFDETDGAIIVAIWNKDVGNFVNTAPTSFFFDFDAAGIALPTTTNQETGETINPINGNFDRIINFEDAGYIRGLELSYTQTFTFLPDLWKGLGVNFNFSLTDSEITLDTRIPNSNIPTVPLPGLSDRIWTSTVYYDFEEKFSARVSARFRSEYIDDQIAGGNQEQAFFEEETIWSAQMSYNYTEQLQVFFSVDNITDEPNISFFGNRAQTGTIQYFGRNMYLGVNYKL